MRVGNHRKRILSLPNVRLGAFEKDEKPQASVSQTDKDGESKTIRERSIGTVLYRFPEILTRHFTIVSKLVNHLHRSILPKIARPRDRSCVHRLIPPRRK